MKPVLTAALALCAVIASAAAGSAVVAAVAGTPGTPCMLPDGAASIQVRSELPKALRDKFKRISMPGEVSSGERFEFIWKRGDRLVALVGSDHDVMSFHILALHVENEGLTTREIPVTNSADPPASLCQLAVMYLKN